MKQSRIVIEDFHSQALEGNPLNDLATRRVPVYLPPGFDQNQRYPSVYLLTAFAARGLKLLNDNLWEENIQERLDRLITGGEIQPMIVVMPDASTRYGGSQYMNSPATGQYDDHILELVSFIDSRYPTKSEAASRAVMGHSSGGYGALRMGMRHSDTFGLVAAHAPDLYFEMVYQKDFPRFLQYYEKVGEEGIIGMLADPGGALSKGASFYALATAAMAACYSPNPEAPWGFDLPFDTFTGELKPEIWARWQAHDPINMAIAHEKDLHKLNLLYGARILSKRFNDLNINHVYEEFEGGHRNTRFRYDVSLRLISENFG